VDRGQQRDFELQRSNAARRTPRYRSMVFHWLSRAVMPPRRPAAANLPTIAASQVGISFAGHATALIRYANLNIVCDPMLGNWCKGVRRAVRAGLSPAELQDVDLILISHGHADHLHRPTLAKLPRSATIVLPSRTAHLVSDLGFARVVELAPDQAVEHRRVDIATTAVRHGSKREPALGFVIRGNGPSVFFCGDSGYFDGFSEIGRQFSPDIALLPIGGYAPASFRDRHMSPLDAVYAFEDLGARVMIPIHYGSFALSYELLHDPERWLAEIIARRKLDSHVQPLQPGESRVFVQSNRKRRAVSGSGIEIDFDEEGPSDLAAAVAELASVM
jgi:L-ascorbate metabolism protein UlaG (beta-lactamase superfamily)